MKSVVEFVLAERFNCLPFRGSKPFEIVLPNAYTNLAHQSPQALVSHDLFYSSTTITTYQIAITCKEEEYNRFVFQYAHEVAHYYTTPFCHPFLEVCCVAVSLSTLTLCDLEWKRLGTLPSSYCGKFQAYRDRVELNPTSEEIGNGSKLAHHVLDLYENWKPLTSIAQCLCDDHMHVDFKRWIRMNTDFTEFTSVVVSLFEYEFGRGEG